MARVTPTKSQGEITVAIPILPVLAQTLAAGPCGELKPLTQESFWNELLTMLRELQGRRPRLFYIPPKLFQIALLLTNCKHIWERLGGQMVVDTSKLQSLGWHPPVKTFDGLRHMLSAESGEGLSENGKVQPLR